MVNNTIALNTTTGISNNGSGLISGVKNNLIAGNGSGGTSNVTGLTLNAADKNLTGTLADVGLSGNLTNNGGPTLTHALLTGSAAINAGINSAVPTGVTTDQRGTGFDRISGGSVDIGAFEIQSLPTLTLAGGITPVEPLPGTLTNGTYTLSFTSAPTTDLTVNFNLSGTASRGADYTLVAGSGITNIRANSFVIAAGTTSATLTVQVIDDTLEETAETIQLSLDSGTGYALDATSSRTLTIAANDTPGTIVLPVTPLAATPIFIAPQQTFTLNKATQKLLATQPPGLQQLFDEAYYLNKNADVAAALARGGFQSGFQHFLTYGQYEGRNPSALYNEQYYLSQNADVAAAVAKGGFRCGFQHFLQFGEYEGRNFSTLFNEQTYLRQNTDVAAAVSKGGFRSGIQHFLQFGFNEGRLTSLTLFNESYYLSQNPTVAAAVARGGFQSGLQHFELYGQREGRRPSQLFDEFYYLNQNADVAVAVAKGSFKSGFEHYLDFGRFEGRSGIG